MNPTRAEYDLGVNRHQQPVKLVKTGEGWSIHKSAANQRDDSQFFELSENQIRVIALIYQEQIKK